MLTEFTFNCRVSSRFERCILKLLFGSLAPTEPQSGFGGIALIENNIKFKTKHTLLAYDC